MVSPAIVSFATSCVGGFVSTEVSIIVDFRPSSFSTTCRTVPTLVLLSNIPQATSDWFDISLDCRVAPSLPDRVTKVAYPMT